MIVQIEKIIKDLENRKTSCDKAIKNTEHAKVGKELLEHMYASGGSDALKYAINELMELLPK